MLARFPTAAAIGALLGFGYAAWVNYDSVVYQRARWGYACYYGHDFRLLVFALVGAIAGWGLIRLLSR